MGEVRDRYPHAHQLFTQIVCLTPKDQLIDAFKSVGPVIGFRYSSQAWQKRRVYDAQGHCNYNPISDLSTTEILESPKATVSVSLPVRILAVQSPIVRRV